MYPIHLSPITGKPKKSAVVLIVKGNKIEKKEYINEMEVISAKYTVRKILFQ